MTGRIKTTLAGLGFGGLVIAALGSYAVAAPGGVSGGVEVVLDLLLDPGFGLEQISFETTETQAAVDDVADQVAQVATAVGDLQDAVDGIIVPEQLEVSVIVNRDACETVPVQCAGFGHGYEEPMDGNHAVMALSVLVTENGVPVAGLTEDNFDFGTAFVPAGGSGLALCEPGVDCSEQTAMKQNGGVYLVWVHPAVDWNSGVYANRLTVTDDEGRSGAALVEIEID